MNNFTLIFVSDTQILHTVFIFLTSFASHGGIIKQEAKQSITVNKIKKFDPTLHTWPVKSL